MAGGLQIKTEDQGTRLELAAGANLCQLVQKIKEAFGGWDSNLCRLQIRSGFKGSGDGLLAFESFVGTDLSTSPRYTASEEAFNNSVLVQGRVVPPSALKLRSVGAREDSQALYQGVVNRRDRPQIWQGKIALDTEQGFRTTKWRTSKCSSGQRPCKRRVRRLRLVLLEAQPDQVRSVRLSTAGKYEKGAVSSAGVGSQHSAEAWLRVQVSDVSGRQWDDSA